MGRTKALDPDDLVFRIATWLIPLIVAIVLHEISHGWVANAFGDPTASDQGRLSLNPVRHVDRSPESRWRLSGRRGRRPVRGCCSCCST